VYLVEATESSKKNSPPTKLKELFIISNWIKGILLPTPSSMLGQGVLLRLILKLLNLQDSFEFNHIGIIAQSEVGCTPKPLRGSDLGSPTRK
jgi:hypothetical protein